MVARGRGRGRRHARPAEIPVTVAVAVAVGAVGGGGGGRGAAGLVLGGVAVVGEAGPLHGGRVQGRRMDDRNWENFFRDLLCPSDSGPW